MIGVDPIVGPPASRMTYRQAPDGTRYPWLDPCIRTERYLHVASGRIVTINQRRGFAFSSLRNVEALRRIGVFYYRGNGQGEGCTGTRWFVGPRRGHMLELLSHIVDGGLIVTDGSGCYYGWGRNDYEPLDSSARRLGAEACQDRANWPASFQDRDGRTFECVGYAGERYGATFCWRVRHARGRCGEDEMRRNAGPADHVSSR